ncbi:MAG: CPBP family intramembrane metalloprotease [Clostridia bacterium]|nr:CPBP family intramembrane metalloprotease [Clostridia bacterium]
MIEDNNAPFSDTPVFEYDFEKMIKEKNIKTKIRKNALIIGIPYILCFLVAYFWGDVYLFAASFSGVSPKEAILFVNRPAVLQLVQIFLSVFMFTCPFILSLKFSGKTVSETVPLKRPKAKSAVPYYFLGLSFCFFSDVAVSYAGSFFESLGFEYSVDYGTDPTGIFGFLLTIIASCIIPALVEELAFRGIAMGILLPFGESFALFTTAFLFGIMHGNFEQMPFAFLVGIILGLVRIKTETLWIPILIHFSNNFISNLLSYSNRYFSSEAINVFYAIIILVALFILIPSLKTVENRFSKEAISLNRKTEEISEKGKYKTFFTSPIIIIAIALFFYEALKFFV